MSLHIAKHTPAYWQVTLDNPPLNVMDPEMIKDLEDLMDTLEADKEIKVVVFDSANPDYFMAHIDLVRSGEFDLSAGPSGFSPWPAVARRLELAPFITIGLLRGRARGVGSEFLQALDIRFASKEKAKLAQIEVGCGLIPGGGGLERLPRMIGRGRALEVIIGADDFDADRAEMYGWVNRSIPDAELDEYVDRFARRLEGFEAAAMAAAKKVIYERTGLATVEQFSETQQIFFSAITWPGTQARIQDIMARGFQQPGDFELNIGERLGPQ